ncbi:hypothetical protein IQ06DRAFT_289752 [Phaeosphaeriaceae sp. SRC1lsM3a]|nr:hypothetical protein IQ06DRAFT_289752 [Stagonospora sp. SRC1lsM3a]
MAHPRAPHRYRIRDAQPFNCTAMVPSATACLPRAGGTPLEVHIYLGQLGGLTSIYISPDTTTNFSRRPTTVHEVYTLPCISIGTFGYSGITPRRSTILPCLRPISSREQYGTLGGSLKIYGNEQICLADSINARKDFRKDIRVQDMDMSPQPYGSI